MSIQALLSAGDGSDVEVDLRVERMRRIRDDHLLWVDVTEPSDADLATLESSLGVDHLVLDALRRPLRLPELIVLDEAVDVVLLWLDDPAADESAPLQAITGDGWVITRHSKRFARIDQQRENITDQREVGLLRPIEFLRAILDWHVDGFDAAVLYMEREVDHLDEQALRGDGDLLPRLVAMRRRIAHMRRVAATHLDVYNDLARSDYLPRLNEDDAVRMRDASKRLERAIGSISQVREMLIGTFDVHMTRTSQRTNDIMRVLTWTSVILLPAVVVAGIMGMNFKVPIFEVSGLFWVVIGFMVLMAATTLVVARWRGWL